MKKVFLLLAVVFFFACGKEHVRTRNCNDNLNCTLNFAYITIQFIDRDGEGVNVKNYSAVNQRTNDTIKSIAGATWNTLPGVYVVVDDSYTKKLSENGDDIKVSGTDSVSNVTKTAIIKVAGGKCACHINKISGPEKVQFD